MTFQLNVGVEMLTQHGAVYARVQTGPGTHVHVFATALQRKIKGSEAESRAVRFAQWRELAALIRRRAGDGQPIIISGNLNVNGLTRDVRNKKSGNEYERLFKQMSLESYTMTDGLMQTFNEHPVTYGVREFLLTDKDDVDTRQRLDYIFLLSREDGQYTITGQTSQVVKFEIDGSKNVSQLSDHYGIESDILFNLAEPDTGV